MIWCGLVNARARPYHDLALLLSVGGLPGSDHRPRSVIERLPGASSKALPERRRRYIVRGVDASDGRDRLKEHLAAGEARLSVDALLDDARSALVRLEPAEAQGASEVGALLVDIRPLEQRERDGAIPGALVIDRNVLEWRLDPASEFKEPSVGSRQSVVIICNEGYSSSSCGGYPAAART